MPKANATSASDAQCESACAPQDISIPVTDFKEVGHDYYPTPDAGEWWSAVTSELEPMWTGEDTVENSTSRAVERVNEIFSRR